MGLYDDVQAAAVYSAYRSSVTGQTNGLVQPWDIYSRQVVEFSNEYLWRALRQAEADYLLESLEQSSKCFAITDRDMCREVIAREDLPQSQKSQADQHVKAAQEVAEAPTPKLTGIWHLVQPLTESFLTDLAKLILNIIMPN